MKKLTQILSLHFTANFLSEENSEGKVLSASESKIIGFEPFENLQKISKSVNGNISEDSNGLQMYVPLSFQNNTVDDSVIYNYPDELNFYMKVKDLKSFAYCGLNFNVGENQLLYLTPKNATKEYVFQNSTFQAKTCGKANVISSEDIVVQFPADISRDKLIDIAGSSILNADVLKIQAGDKQAIFSLNGNLTELHILLKSFINKKTSLKIRKNSDDSLLKEFADVFVTQTSIPADVIGIISIPKTALKTNEPDFEKYSGLNHFVAHFPVIKTKLELEISVNRFDSSDKLFVDNKSISFSLSNHPAITHWKKISCTVDNHTLYLNKQKNILLKTGNKTYELPVNPMLTFDYKTGKSKINITKNIN